MFLLVLMNWDRSVIRLIEFCVLKKAWFFSRVKGDLLGSISRKLLLSSFFEVIVSVLLFGIGMLLLSVSMVLVW